MPIYRMSLKVGSGGSSKHYDYIARENQYKYYNKGEDFIYKESFNLPSWTENNPNNYWKAVNDFEKGTHYREFELALPKELSNEENIKLVKEYCKNTFENNYTYSMAIHKNDGSLSGEKNPHAHIMFSERKIDYDREEEPTKLEYFKQRRQDKETGRYKNGYIKDRDITGKNRNGWLIKQREEWANIQNYFLEKNNIQERVNHRSYKELGLDIEPQIHLGSRVIGMMKQGIETYRWELYNNIEISNKISERIKVLQEELLLEQLELEKYKLESKSYMNTTNEEMKDIKNGVEKKANSNVVPDKKSLEEIVSEVKNTDTKEKESFSSRISRAKIQADIFNNTKLNDEQILDTKMIEKINELNIELLEKTDKYETVKREYNDVSKELDFVQGQIKWLEEDRKLDESIKKYKSTHYERDSAVYNQYINSSDKTSIFKWKSDKQQNREKYETELKRYKEYSVKIKKRIELKEKIESVKPMYLDLKQKKKILLVKRDVIFNNRASISAEIEVLKKV